MIVGLATAIAALFGPLWVVRIGVAVAGATAIVIVVLAGRELARVRNEYAQRSDRTTAMHRSALERTQRQQAATLAATERSALESVAAAERTRRQQAGRAHRAETTVAQLRTELAEAARSARSLGAERAAQNAEILRLQTALAVAEPIAPFDDGSTADGLADVQALPRHGLAGGEASEGAVNANAPTRPATAGRDSDGRSTVLQLPQVDPGWDNLEVDVARG